MTKMKFGDFEYTEEELRRQIEEATARAAEADRKEHRAVRAYYDRDAGRIVVDLATGVTVLFPPELLQGLGGASPDDLAEVEVSPHGTSLHWEELDADFSVNGLISGVFGTRAWMADLGSRGGKVTSEAKAAAARANGMKGGRPRKVAASPPPQQAQTASGHNAPEFAVFEARLLSVSDFRPARLTKAIQGVDKLPVRELESARQQLQLDAESLPAAEEIEVAESRMMLHPLPKVPSEVLGMSNVYRFEQPESELGLIG
jgi:hypothetical protein